MRVLGYLSPRWVEKAAWLKSGSESAHLCFQSLAQAVSDSAFSWILFFFKKTGLCCASMAPAEHSRPELVSLCLFPAWPPKIHGWAILPLAQAENWVEMLRSPAICWHLSPVPLPGFY